MSKFKEGDIVRLKSGGPAMTVAGITADGKYLCYWHTEDLEIAYWEFPEETIILN